MTMLAKVGVLRPGTGQRLEPGMMAASGMRGWVFAPTRPDRVPGAVAVGICGGPRTPPHRSFPSLRHRSRAADDPDDITGDLVELDPPWTTAASG
jgi:hypothetical protein